MPASPRIAYLTGIYPWISLTFIQREIEALRGMGLEVATYAIRPSGPEEHPGPAEREAARTTFYVLPAMKRIGPLLAALGWSAARPGRLWAAKRLAWRTRGGGLKATLYQGIYLAEAMVLARQLSRDGVTHLHNHFVGASATVAMLASELSGIPFSFTLHGPTDLEEPRRWRLDEKAARAAFVACISHYARSQLMLQSDPAQWDRFRIIHCGVRPALYTPGDRDEGLHLVFVGRLAAAKGLRVLLDAFGPVHAARPDARLTIVGHGADKPNLEAIARPFGEAVRLTGPLSQSEVAEMLATADLFVLPSFAEGVPVVLMEAMAARVPVVATRIAGVAELVEDGVSGRLVPPGDPRALARAILDLAETPPEARAGMGRAGRARVEAEFDIDAEAARLARLILGGPGKAIRPGPLEGNTP